MSRESDEVKDGYSEYQERGDYMASLSEEYYWAVHPDERPYLMDKIEVKRIIKEYENLVHTEIQSPQTSSTSEKASL